MMLRRRGVTLLITLSVIASMLALVGILFGYLDTARKEAGAKSALIQGDMLRADIVSLLKQQVGRAPSLEVLQALYSTPLAFSMEEEGFALAIQCEPLLNRIRYTWLSRIAEEKRPRFYTVARELYDRLTDEAEVKDPDLLLEMIRQGLEKEPPRFGYPGWPQKKEGIIDSKLLGRIMDDYRFAADDTNVYKIEWEDYFTFSDPIEFEKLDAKFITPSLLAFLYGIDPGVAREGYTPGKIEDFLRELGEDVKRYEWLFEERVVPAFGCGIDYRFREGIYHIRFDYLSQRIDNFGIEKN